MTTAEAKAMVDGCGLNIETQYHDEVMAIIDKALEKQIAQKPLPEEKFYGNGKCPNCNAVFLDRSTNFCGHCGQKLDWIDAE